MSWARLDDRFHEHRKVREAWRAAPASIGLHTMALAYCAGHETDGHVDCVFVEEKLPVKRDRDRAVRALVNAGMWTPTDIGWLIHDYLDFHPSHAELAEKRAKDSERKARGRQTQSARRADGIHAESARNPDGVRAVSSGPNPTQPNPVKQQPDAGVLEQVIDILTSAPSLFVEPAAVDSAIRAYPDADPIAAARIVASRAHAGQLRTSAANSVLMGVLSKQPAKTADHNDTRRRRTAALQSLMAEEGA